jgi:hypothetical protein
VDPASTDAASGGGDAAATAPGGARRRLQGDAGGKAESEDYRFTNRMNIIHYRKIDLQFDFRNELMAYMRQLAIKTYWYLLAVIVA